MGRFATQEDAAHAYDDASRQHFGSQAVTNFNLDRTHNISVKTWASSSSSGGAAAAVAEGTLLVVILDMLGHYY